MAVPGPDLAAHVYMKPTCPHCGETQTLEPVIVGSRGVKWFCWMCLRDFLVSPGGENTPEKRAAHVERLE